MSCLAMKCAYTTKNPHFFCRSPVFLENISSGPMEKRGGRRNNRNQLALQEINIKRKMAK